MAVLPKDRSILISAAAMPAGARNAESGSFWVWRVNQKGETIQKVEIASPDKSRRLKIR